MLNLILYSTYIYILSRNVLFLKKLKYTKAYFNDSIQGIVSCFIFIQRLTIMFVATQLCLLFNSTIGTLEKHSLLILSYQKVSPFLLFIPPEDRDHTDSRRIKPNSRNLLIGEQPNPSKLFPPEVRLSRHRIYQLL